ncbi:MAG: hypothetical protein M1817_005602 [Caeruleum heppii]|nr:MAG: hypothetical protein M1817_005602 [Caeruleum heppii]
MLEHQRSMGLWTPTYVLSILLLLYASSFVFFALLRIITGISIQRIGYFSLRRLAYTFKHGIKLEIRGLGLVLHRPTFAQPTWISLVVQELQVTVDLIALAGEKDPNAAPEPNSTTDEASGPYCALPSVDKPRQKVQLEPIRSQTWHRLTMLKEKLKRLHRIIHWLKLIDVVATNSTLAIADIGSLEIGTFSIAVDTRRKTVDRSRLFHHRKTLPNSQSPAEWMITVRSVLFTSQGREPLEILDHGTLNIHGLLHSDTDGLRDAAIALKLGRVHLPYDDFITCAVRLRHCREVYRKRTSTDDYSEISLTDVMEELDMPGTQEEKILQTITDSKKFFTSMIRGIKEIQFAVSFLGLTKQMQTKQSSGKPMFVNLHMKEVGIDLHRLDPRSPAHRMYFAPGDISHEALLAAIGISVDVDDGDGDAERLVYLPMLTTTVKTTLPSKTVQMTDARDVQERNTNILFANVVITSPSIDLDPKHLPLVVALLQFKPTTNRATSATNHHLLSRLLPKASIKLSVHEPVFRVSLPAVEKDRSASDDYDLLISSNSSISLDIESSHGTALELHYSLFANLRILSHQFYYQTASGIRHDLLTTESLELKTQVRASPDVYVALTGDLRTFSVHLVRPEISEGVRQIVKQLKSDLIPDQGEIQSRSPSRNLLRRLPAYLLSVHLQGSDFGLEVAGIDQDISDTTRGVALQLKSWTADYRAQRQESHLPRTSRRRGTSQSSGQEHELLEILPPSPKFSSGGDPADGRRVAFHIRGLEGFMIESADAWEPEPSLSLPRLEVAFSTSSDNQGNVLHVHAYLKTLLLQYSLYRHYSMCVAVTVVKNVLGRNQAKTDHPKKLHSPTKAGLLPRVLDDVEVQQSPVSAPELVTLDIKAAFIQVKAALPADPALMLQVYSLDAGRHRWAAPFWKAKGLRLYVQAPKMKRVWARLLSIKTARLDLWQSRRKSGSHIYTERSINILTEAVRLNVPHQLVMHKVFDNLVNVSKATEQLHHRVKTGTNEYILNKRPEGPKNVPRISWRSKALTFELEDSSFEWKLSTIYRLGLIEQKHRLAREAAFEVKAKRLQEPRNRFAASRSRTRLAQPSSETPRNRSQDSRRNSTVDGDEEEASSRPSQRKDRRGSQVRYDPACSTRITDSAKVSAHEAWDTLQRYNSQAWKKRIDWALDFQRSAMKDIQNMLWGNDDIPDDVEDHEQILELPRRPGLMTTTINDLQFVIDKPSFPVREYSDYVHRVGKGMPHDMKYSLLIPMSVRLDMGEARMNLRDYPLPLVHIPALRSSQSARLPSWSIRTDFVIAEEYRDSESSRHVKVEIVPPEDPSSDSQKGAFAIDVRRTVSPVKTYSDVEIHVNTSSPTRITWGTAYQPVIQDMMMVIESFTKPQVDPSERAGFWDKIRLSVHSRINIVWKGDGDVHLLLKGSRDPYVVTGQGAGFVMCWRNDVRWRIGQDDDPKKFMTVDSGEYVLAIPDFSHQARQSMDLNGPDSESLLSSSSHKNGALFKKVIMKLSGNVQWLAGLVFERNLDGGGRSFDFKPHYEVTMRNPKFAKAAGGGVYDAFKGFRSHHIHLSIAVAAPVDRDWSVTNLKPSTSYNTVHLSPRFFTHFFSWWSLFSGVMSLPIRQGRLWPGLEKSSKKFGRHLATIKYNLLLSPLFISHVYKHKDAEDYAEDKVSATGLKVRLDSFMLDLHQRREEFASQATGRKSQTRTSGMRINRCQLDFISADIRAVSASIGGTTAEDLKRASEETLAAYQQSVPSVDMSRFTIPDNDFSWIDMDDFVELDWMLPAESNPETKIMPLAYAPRFTYFRQTDHHDSISGDPTRSSAFGNEPTHICVMSHDNDPRRIQSDLVWQRLDELEKQTDNHVRALGEAELRVVRDDYKDRDLREYYEMLKQHGEVLQRKKASLQSMLRGLSARQDDGNDATIGRRRSRASGSTGNQSVADTEGADTIPLADFSSEFNNRFTIHNVQMKWNNTLRNIILRYTHQVSQRRGFVYYMSRRAVKFIVDIVEEQGKSQSGKTQEPSNATSSQPTTPAPPYAQPTDEHDSEASVQDRILELLDDAKKFVNADDPSAAESAQKAPVEDVGDHVAGDFTPQNSYHIRLIAPQIQLQSERNVKSAVLVTAKSMQLKVIQIMDKNRVSDDISGLVQRRFSMHMDSVQFFVSHRKSLAREFLHLSSGARYGSPAGSSWPPWVPMEVMYDFQIIPLGFSRVVQKTSASLRYDKYNTLRLKYNDEISSDDPSHPRAPSNLESRIDQLWVDFPQVRAMCDSSQYYAMYIIVLDLLLYSEPLEKVRSERLEKIMLASDFSDLRGAPEMVMCLQDRIRQLEEIKMHFQIHAKYLDRQGWEDRLSVEQDLAGCEDELFFMMKAITTSQRKYEDRAQTTGLLKWSLSASQVVWHLVREQAAPLMEFQLQNAAYERTDNSDGSNENAISIEYIHGLNLLPDAIYPDMVAPFNDDARSPADGRDMCMLRVNWHMLEAIAGIPVMDYFEINLFPLKVQLEREVGKKLFEYIFPGVGSNAFENGGFSPFMTKNGMAPVQDDSDDSADERKSSSGSRTSHSPSDERDATGTESLEARLKPTLTLRNHRRTEMGPPPKPRHGHSNSAQGEGRHFKMFHSQDKPRSRSKPPKIRTPTTKISAESLRMTSMTSRSSTSLTGLASSSSSEKPKRFGLQRSLSKDYSEDPQKSKKKKKKASDDLTQMMSRASNYMTLAYVKIPSVVLCLSYKGRGERNLEDVHDFVFRMPSLEYRNKTWSNLDLALQLKKDAIKALISHTGAIIGNKFSHHRPTKQQQSRLREVANHTSLLSVNGQASGGSDTSSLRGSSPGTGRSASPRRSFASGRDPNPMTRTDSFASVQSAMAYGGASNPDSLSMSGTTVGQMGEEESHRFVPNAIGRHLPSMGSRHRDTDGASEQSDDNNRRKSKLLLGKKLLGSLGQG